MKKLFSIFCCLLLSASMVTQAQLRETVNKSPNGDILHKTNLTSGRNNAPTAIQGAWDYESSSAFNQTFSSCSVAKSDHYSYDNLYILSAEITNTYWLYLGFNVTLSNGKIPAGTYTVTKFSNYGYCEDDGGSNYYMWITYPANTCAKSQGIRGSGSGWRITPSYIESNSNTWCIQSGSVTINHVNNGCGYYVTTSSLKNYNGKSVSFTIGRDDYTYTITAVSSDNSLGSVSGGGSKKEGSNATLTANAAAGCSFVRWHDGNTDNPRTINVTGNATYTAYFVSNTAAQYTISTAVSPAAAGTVTGAGSYFENNPATLTATSANEHLYIFDHWLKDGVTYAGGATITPTVTAAATYTAVFRAANAGTITAATNNASYGTATASPSGNQPGGTAVTLTTTPNAGYAFTQWNDGNTDNPRTVYVDGNKTYTAQFVVETPLCAAVKYNTANHEILWAKHGDSDWNPDYQTWYDTPDNFVRVRASDYTDNSMNHIQLCFWVDDYSITYNGTIGPKEGTYVVAMAEVMASGNKNNYWWLDKDTYLNKAVVGFNENQGLSNSGWNTSQARIWSTSQSPYIAYIANQTCDYCSPTDFLGVPVGSTVKVARGKGGNCYVEVRNALGRLLFTIGEPSQPYTLAWDANGGELSGIYTAAGSVNEGTTITAPTATKTGYTFTGWSPSFTGTMPSNNVTYTAQWSINSHNVTWDVNGGNALTGNYTNGSTNYGTTIVAPNNPTKNATAEYTYTFDGWKPAVDATMPDNDVTYTAIWYFKIRSYTITWKSGETILEIDEDVNYGLSAEYNGPMPTKDATAEYTYTFGGWSPLVTAVISDATYNVIFKETKVQYYLTWVFNGGLTVTNGNEYTHGKIDWGTTIVSPADPTKTGYTFAGWSPAVDATMPVANTTYTAQWNPITYHINYEGLNGVTNNNQTTYNIESETITLADPGTRDGYAFTGWTMNNEPITQIPTGSYGDLTITANWESAITTYDVTITSDSDYGTTNISNITVKEGSTITIIKDTIIIGENTIVAIPNDNDSFGYSYVFNGWINTNGEIPETVTEDLTISANFIRELHIILQENETDSYYDDFQKYNGVKTTTVTLNRQFKEHVWSTICLPFDVNSALMSSLKMRGRVYEFKYATGNANIGEGVNLYFAQAKSIKAGVPYIVNANEQLASKTSFVFPNVTINTTADSVAPLNSLKAYNRLGGHKARGTIELVGTHRKGILQGTETGNTYMGLKNNYIYYPNIENGSTIWAYRAIFRSTKPLNTQRVRIITEDLADDIYELTLEDIRIFDENKKYIKDGVLYIEYNGEVYNTLGQRIYNIR